MIVRLGSGSDMIIREYAIKSFSFFSRYLSSHSNYDTQAGSDSLIINYFIHSICAYYFTFLFFLTAIGADLLDTTGKLNIDHENNLEEKNTVFAMDKAQKTFTDLNKHNVYIREAYHSMHESVWDRGYTSDFMTYPER